MATSTLERRAGSPPDAVGGKVPQEVVRPSTVAEVVEAMRAAAADGRTVVPVGAGTKTSWAAAPTSCDLLLDTTGLDRVVEHVAGDLIVVAEAGVRLADLQSHVGRAGQLLGLDPPEPGATLGGVVSANASGPRRLRYGTVHAQGVRDQPRRMLRGIPGVELRELVEAEICCRSAGTYNLLQPGPARELGERKARAVLDTGADVMVTANPGCWMQVATTLARMGKALPVAHTVQVLDASIRGVPVEHLLERALTGPGTVMTSAR